MSQSLPFTGRVAPRSGVGWGKPHRLPLLREPHPAAFGRRPPRKGEVLELVTPNSYHPIACFAARPGKGLE
ncbi:hypothetical protein SS37A_25040 [Methylocystis iwaonis]|uniref:Uncharacterized protein n=1 Tax=Methylocystis iwaonis TaxID=2885079 RepID=A0ABM8EAI2_9HYPH|nr:hypothetical protein SS37A_25040 [Methylocystis iwaonis]